MLYLLGGLRGHTKLDAGWKNENFTNPTERNYSRKIERYQKREGMTNMKKYILYSGVIVCFIACSMICMFWGVQKKTSLHSYTTKMDLLAQDNILDSVKREVSDFLWCGYSPDTYMELEQKSEVPRSEIFPYVYSTPILKAYQIEKQAYAGSFDSIPVVLQAVLSFLQDRQWNGNPPFLREIFPIFSSLSRVQINYESIPENVLKQEIKMLDSLDHCVSKIPPARGNKHKETVLFYIRANRILALHKLGLYSVTLPKIHDPFDPSYKLVFRQNASDFWIIRTTKGVSSEAYIDCAVDWWPLSVEDQVCLDNGVQPVLRPDLYEYIRKLWTNGKIETDTKRIILRNRNGDLMIEPKPK